MKLARNVLVRGRWYGPAHGNADSVPDDVAALISNPRAWGGERPLSLPETAAASSTPDGPDVEPVQVEVERPKGNAGHGAWAAYRVARGEVTDVEAEDMTRDELRDMDN